MEFYNMFMPTFGAILSANFAIAIVAYAVVLQRQGHQTGAIVEKTGRMVGTVLVRSAIICLGLFPFAALVIFCIELLSSMR